MRVIDFTNNEDAAAHRRILTLAESMQELHRRLDGTKPEAQTRNIRRQIAATDAEIDRLVYELYGLTDEEIAIVEGDRP